MQREGCGARASVATWAPPARKFQRGWWAGRQESPLWRKMIFNVQRLRAAGASWLRNQASAARSCCSGWSGWPAASPGSAPHVGLAPRWPWSRRQRARPRLRHLCLHGSVNRALLSLAFETRTINHADTYFLCISEFIQTEWLFMPFIFTGVWFWKHERYGMPSWTMVGRGKRKYFPDGTRVLFLPLLDSPRNAE